MREKLRDDAGLLRRLAHIKPRWHADAACREHPEIDFVPPHGVSAAPAKAVCRRCLVVAECLAYALEHDEVGVWGGTSTRERVALRRRAA